MTDAALPRPRLVRSRSDPNHLGHAPGGANDAPASGRGAGGPAPKRIVVAYGFWIFVLSDIVMFSAFFAGYAVLQGGTAGGPSERDLVDLPNTAVETVCLLLSSCAAGFASLALSARKAAAFQVAMAATFVLGAAFVALEAREFAGLITEGNGPSRSAFLSAFFALVGCHGLHVTVGLLWLLAVMAQLATRGFRPDVLRRAMCFALFWHALDIVWVALFTVVYLMGLTS